MAKDPVCGMTIEESKTAVTYEYKGKTHYYCAPGCKLPIGSRPVDQRLIVSRQ